MKKVINKYRNTGSNSFQYSLSYKFDSISCAGKISGTALELIKKYNELAKEAHSNGNYPEMENFRQYAEHYRKIVTEINEKKTVQKTSVSDQNKDVADTENQENSPENTEQAEQNVSSENTDSSVSSSKTENKKEFKVVEVKAEEKAKTKEKRCNNRKKLTVASKEKEEISE